MWERFTSWVTSRSRRSAAHTPRPAATSATSPSLGQRRLDAFWQRRDRERLLAEQTAYAPPFELVNPWAQFFDGFKLLFPLFPSRFDYRYSQNYIFLTQGQLDLFRSYARYLYETNSYADGGLNCLADYTIGTGFDYHCTVRPAARASKALLKACDKVIEDFANSNDWWELEREFFIRPKRDGDAFLRFFPQEDGITQVRSVEPEQVRTLSDDQNWSFGIQTAPGDRTKILAYSIWYGNDNQAFDIVPADEMLMFKNRLDRSTKRGISDFFNLQDLLEDSAKLLRAGRQGEAVRQSIALVRQFAQANQATVQALQASDTDYTLPKYQATPQASPQQEAVHQVMPGEIHDIPCGLQYQPPPTGNMANMKVALDSTLQCVAVKWRVPAWVLTGDVNSNFAAALVAESPLTKRCEWDQFNHSKRYVKVMHRVLDIASQQGVLPQDALDQVQVQAEGVPIAARNLKDETFIAETLRRHRILSRRTWAARESLDLDEEQQNIEADGDDDVPATPTETRGAPDSGTPGAEYQREVNR